MCSISVIPMPSRMSTPKCPVHRSYRLARAAPHRPRRPAGRRAARRPGSPARSMLAKNVGPGEEQGGAVLLRRVGDRGPGGTGRAPARPRRRPRAGTAPSCPGRRRRTPWPRTGTGRRGGYRAPGCRTSRRPPGRARAGAWRPWAARSCPRCTARTRASRRWSGTPRASARPGGQRAERVHRDRAARHRAVGQHPGQLGRAGRGRRPRRPRTPGHGQEPGPGIGAAARPRRRRVQHRGHRHRDRAHPHRGQVDDDELRRVGHQHQQPLLGLQPERRNHAAVRQHLVVQGGVAHVPGRRRPAPSAARRPRPAAGRAGTHRR